MGINLFSWFSNTATLVEQDVLNFIQKAEQGFQIAVTDCENVLQWVAQQTPAIAADLQMVTSFVGAVPAVAGNPEVLAAVTAANLAVQGLNAFAQSYNQATAGGGITVTQATQAIVSGYQAVKSAQAATASVASTAVGATTTAKASS